MAYEGWLRFGGNEVVNNERSRGIASTVDCPMFWLKGPRCTTLQDALGDAEYTAANLADAPWFDGSLPDVSGRFFGVFALSVAGLNDSTRSASVVEGIDDGATIGRTRKGARQVRVRAMLLARGRDALDYGVAWLNAALDPDACGQHGTGCGTTDLEFLTDCPPERGTVPDFTPWAESRRNLFTEPNPVNAASWSGYNITRSYLENAEDGQYGHGVSTGGSIYWVPTAGRQVPTAPGESITVQADARGAVGATRIRIFFYDSVGAQIAAVNGDAVTLGPAWQHLSATAVAPPGTVAMSFWVLGSSGVAGDVFDIRRIMVGDPGSYFDGDSEPTELRRYSWSGAVDNSASIEESRSPIERPRTDEEYAALVDPYRRFLHNVSVTSGPLERELMNKGEFWGQIFEWTYTAGRPWVYSITRAVDLPITPTIVIQDTPYNLVPYPSAELAGDDVDAAYNFSANPSVETNATGWAFSALGGITSAMLAAGRVTGELSAVGNAAYRVVFTATGAGVDGTIYAYQEVNVSGRPAGSRVSINIWAAELLMSGAPVRDPILVDVVWASAPGGAAIRTDVIGTIPVNGGAVSVKSLLPPAGASYARVRVAARLASWPAGTVVRLYADALAVTVP